MLEKDIERKCIDYAESRGWWQIKIMRASKNGFPDRELIRNGRTIRIEFKKPGGVLSPQQVKRIGEIREHGGEVFVIDNFSDAMEILR